jgi:glycosyltransferase involved in cell wall biosynthesis
MSEKGLSIIIPAFNEEKGAALTVQGIQTTMAESAIPFELIVVDDGSIDSTAEIINSLPGVKLLRNIHNRGYGTSLKRGIRAATYDNIAITDADGTYPGDRIPELASLLTDDVDMVVGWRKGFSAKIPLVRRPAKWVIKRIAETLAGYRIPDLNSGLRIFRKQTVLDNEHVLPAGFSFTTTITLLIASGGGCILYEPISYSHRSGQSKFHPIKDTWGMITLIVRSILLFNPLRFFVPVAMLSFLCAIIVLIVSLLWMERIPDGTITILTVTGFQILVLGLLADLINRRL